MHRRKRAEVRPSEFINKIRTSHNVDSLHEADEGGGFGVLDPLEREREK